VNQLRRVGQPACPEVHGREVCAALQGLRVIGTEDPRVALTSLLVERQRGGHLPGREVRGGKDAPGDDRVHVIGAEDPLPVCEDSFELGDGVLDAAAGQIGVGELLARGHRVRMPRSLDPLVVGQRAPLQRDRVVGPSRGTQRGG
jgi:hypothetical protein